MNTLRLERYPANRIQGILRLKDNNVAVGPLRPARSSDASTIQSIAVAIAESQLSTKQFLLTTGFGLDKNLAIPIRLPALIIPGLQLMERMADAKLPIPPYLLYQATAFIAETNDIDRDAAQECATSMRNYLQEYIETFHSRIAENVHIRFGCEYEERLRADVASITESIRQRIGENTDVSMAMQQLQTSEKKHSNGSGKHLAYAAANILYNGASGTYPFTDDLAENVHAILPIGGRAEKPFFMLTSDFADRDAKIKVIPMLTPLGEKPTYYHYPELGDPLTANQFQTALGNTSLNGPIRADLASMISDTGDTDAVAAILSNHS